jgi:carbamoyl-phosphate synthase large subunit
VRVLLLGAGGPVGIGTTRSLQAAGHYVIGTDCSETGRLLSVADETHELPPADTDLEYAKALFKLIWQVKPHFVHAQSDIEVFYLGRHRSMAPRYWLPSQDTIKACQDKWRSYSRWKGKIPVPDTYLIRGREALFNFLSKYGEGWIRLTKGGGGAGSIKTDHFTFATEWVNRHKGWGKMTIAEVLPGPSVTWQSLWNHGELVACQQRERLSWANARNSPSGVSGSTGVGQTVFSSTVDGLARASCLAIDAKPHGLFGVDMTYNKDGVPCPTEINVGRFFTTVDFFTKAGFNFPDFYVKAAVSVEQIEKKLNPIPPGRKWLRSMDREPVLV